MSYRIFGGTAAGSGTTELAGLTTDVEVAAVAQGDVLYRGATKWNNLAAGGAGAPLISGGAAANPAWATSLVATQDNLSLYRGVNAQVIDIYGTRTDADNYERLRIAPGATFHIAMEMAGTGGPHDLNIKSTQHVLIQAAGGCHASLQADAGSVEWRVAAAGHWTAQGNYNLWNGTSALATTDTAGFLGVNSCAGPPTGVPASIPTGQVPLVFDTTNGRLYFYHGAAWHYVAQTA